MSSSSIFFLFFLFFFFFCSHAKIYDPLNIFCGSENCYDILKVPRSSTLSEIKKSFRNLSLNYHPDKNKAANATEVFRSISKASEVLTNEESRNLFNYYLDNPRDYYKVSGQHYIHTLPKVSVLFISLILLTLLSLLTYYNQLSRHNKLKKFLRQAAGTNLAPKDGGTKETQAIYSQAVAKYTEKFNPKKRKLAQLSGDKDFEAIIVEIVDSIQIEGGYRKPSLRDLFVLQIILFPYTIYKNSRKLYRRHYATDLSEEEKLQFTIDTIGLGTWHNLEEEEKDLILSREIWIEANFLAWKEEKEEEYLRKMQKAKKKLKKKYNITDSDLENSDFEDYVE